MHEVNLPTDNPTEGASTEAGDLNESLEHFGNYRVIRTLGTGGMGEVYLAEDVTTGQKVALKLLQHRASKQARLRRRFERESTLIQDLQHDHIVPLLDSGVDEGTQYLVMRYIDGQTLADRISKEGKNDDTRICMAGPSGETVDTRIRLEAESASSDSFKFIAESIANVADALQAAHNDRVIHRDVKPSNLMFDSDGKIWLTDFGLAFSEDENTALTMTGDVLGTPAYMSPEQTSGATAATTPQSDIYSLGVTLYEWATLQRAYSGSRDQILNQVTQGAHTPAGKARPELPRALQAIIGKAMSLTPANRYATAEEFAKDLRRFANQEPVTAKMPGWSERLFRWSERNPLVALVSLIGMVTTIVAVIATISIYSGRLMTINSDLEATNDELSRTNLELATSQEELRNYLYVADMTLAYQAYASHNFSEARKLLEKYSPNAGSSQDKSAANAKPYFAWQLLDRLTREAPSVLLTTHEGEANEVAVSRDGKLALSVGEEGQLHVIDLENKKVLHRHQVGNQLNAVAISPDNRRFVTGLNGSLGYNFVFIGDVQTGDEVVSMVGHQNTIESVAFSSDGQSVASAERYRSVQIHNIDGDLVERYEGESRNECLEFIGDGGNFAFLENPEDAEARVLVWDEDPEKTYVLPTIVAPTSFTFSKPLSDSGELRLVTCNSDMIHVVDGKDRKFVASFKDIPGRIRCVEISDDGRYVCAGVDEGMVLLWDLYQRTNGKRLIHANVIQASEKGISSIKMIAGDRGVPRIVTSSLDGTVRLWDVSDLVWKTPGSDHIASEKYRLHETRSLHHGSSDVYVRFQGGVVGHYRNQSDVGEFRKIGNYPAEVGLAISLAPDGKRMAIGRLDEVVIADSKTGEIVTTIPVPVEKSTGCRDLQFTNDWLVTLFNDRMLLHRADDFSFVDEFDTDDGNLSRLCRVPNEDALIVMGASHLYRFEDQELTLLERLNESEAYAGICFDSKGRQLLTSHHNRVIRIRSYPDLEPIATLKGHRHNVVDQLFLDDDQTVVTSMVDSTIRFWDLKTERQFGSISLAKPTYNNLRFIKDQNSLFVGHVDAPAIILKASNVETGD
ncbi:serine/threonine-protein kinase [Rhodopirellula europaea]|uniref:Serine/threonine-protein kinase n=1 Tax=Rhodopirellula europaea SH398 TaxID=1263868 RepID=M5S6X6_9BACT|nr:serine/threonine-protein kinase [Rhodopirellula europaea SH398]